MLVRPGIYYGMRSTERNIAWSKGRIFVCLGEGGNAGENGEMVLFCRVCLLSRRRKPNGSCVFTERFANRILFMLKLDSFEINGGLD